MFSCFSFLCFLSVCVASIILSHALMFLIAGGEKIQSPNGHHITYIAKSFTTSSALTMGTGKYTPSYTKSNLSLGSWDVKAQD